MALRITTAMCALLAVIGWADVERPFLRLATGRDLVRVTVVIPAHSDHRWLSVSGAVFDAAEDVTWERTSWEQLDGASAPKARTIQWALPRPNPYDAGARTLRVRAAVVCETAEGAAFIP